MERFWSLLFLAVPVMGILIVVGAATQVGFANAWLPESIGPRTEGVDYLFSMIHVILGVVFGLTGLILAFSLWRFRSSVRDVASPVRHNTLLEFAWTAIPAGILVFLAIHQLPFWKANKEDHPVTMYVDESGDDRQQPIARVIARQFAWRFQYPGLDEIFDTSDDLISENLLVLPVDEMIVLELQSEDVIHSFSISQLRLKQDIVPSLSPSIWFKVTQTGEWEINCMEHCGWGHYQMVAKLKVVSRGDYENWQTDKVLEHVY